MQVKKTRTATGNFSVALLKLIQSRKHLFYPCVLLHCLQIPTESHIRFHLLKDSKDFHMFSMIIPIEILLTVETQLNTGALKLLSNFFKGKYHFNCKLCSYYGGHPLLNHQPPIYTLRQKQFNRRFYANFQVFTLFPIKFPFKFSLHGTSEWI